METANEDFIRTFMEDLSEAESPLKDSVNDEDIFWRILNARTVGELYGMDISIEDVERLIPKTELLLRKSENNFWFCRFMTENIKKIQGQKKKNFIF